MSGLVGRINNFIKGLSQSDIQSNEHTKSPVEDFKKKPSLFYDEQKIILDKFQHIKTPSFILEYRNRHLQKKPSQNDAYVTLTNEKLYEDSLKYREKSGTPCEYVELKSYYTTFTHLDNQQLQYYFYWRDSFLNGIILDASLSYRFLFVYELLNYSFNPNAAFNISALVRLLDAYKEREEYSFYRYMNIWISDMLLEIGEERLANDYFNPGKVHYEDRLYQKFKKNEESLAALTYSDWKPYMDIRKPTPFYETHRMKINKAFRESIPILQRLLVEQSGSLENCWFDKRKDERRRYVFQGAVLGRESNRDSYSYLIDAVYVKGQLREDITQLHRLAENVMREVLGEKRMIQAAEEQFPAGLKEEMLRLKIEEQEAKANKKKKTTSRFVTVKGGEKTEGGVIPQPLREESPIVNFVPLEFNDDKIKMLSKENDELQRLFQQYEAEAEKEPKESIADVSAESEEQKIEQAKSKVPDVLSVLSVQSGEAEEDVQALIDELNEKQKQFLQLFQEGELDQKAGVDFIKLQKSMPSVFLDALNEKAEEILGDILIEQDGDTYVINEDFINILEYV